MSLFRKIRKSSHSVTIGTGFSIRKVSSNLVSPISIQDAQRFNHWLTVGTTGSGKTRLLKHIVAHDIRQNYSVAVFDPKPDEGLFAMTLKHQSTWHPRQEAARSLQEYLQAEHFQEGR